MDLSTRGNCFRQYSLFGVTFSSDVVLALPTEGKEVPAQFQLIRAGDSWLSEGTGPILSEERDDWVSARAYQSGDVEIEWGGWLSLWINHSGKTVRYRVQKEAYPTAFEAYVANFAVAAVLLIQGEETLHSTVVSVSGVGIGLLGGSGAGKSTLAAYLLGQGGELVTDDMLRITKHNSILFAEPGQARLKLFRDTARRYFPNHNDVGQWNPLSDKYLFDIEHPIKRRERKRLSALFWLAPSEVDNVESISCHRLLGLELFKVIAGSAMHSKLQTVRRPAQQIQFTHWVATSLPVYALRYPRRHEFLPTVFQKMLRRLQNFSEASCSVID